MSLTRFLCLSFSLSCLGPGFLYAQAEHKLTSSDSSTGMTDTELIEWFGSRIPETPSGQPPAKQDPAEDKSDSDDSSVTGDDIQTPGLPDADKVIRRSSVSKADEPEANLEGSEKESGISMTTPLTWTDGLPLLAVLGLIGLLAWIVKRYLPGRNLIGGSEAMQILARTPVANKQSLVLVRLGTRLVLLGVTNERIASLSEITDPDEVARLVGDIESGRPTSITSAFRETFETEADAYDSVYEDGEDEVNLAARGHLRGLVDRLRSASGSRGAA